MGLFRDHLVSFAKTPRMPVDKSAARVRRMFGEIAPRYDLLNHLLSLNADKYWRWRTVRRAAPSGDAPILDLCTGTGDLALAYARRSMANIVAADFCHEMLVIGRKKAASAGLGHRIEFVEADAEHLPFSDAEFQVVSVAFGLRNVTDTERGLSEMVRVCRPGGQVAVLEFSHPRRWPLSSMYRWYFRRVLPRVGQFFAQFVRGIRVSPAERGRVSGIRATRDSDGSRGPGASAVLSAHFRRRDVVHWVQAESET